MRKLLILFLFLSVKLFAQDPHFTQNYLSTPLNVNPALTGVFSKGKTRFLTDFRTQWVSSANPYSTTYLSADFTKPKDKNNFNFGFSFMNDKSLNGIINSNYISALGSYQMNLSKSDSDEVSNSLGIGSSITYGSRIVQSSQLNFSNQYSFGEFNSSIPSGEIALSNLKPFISLNVGLLYRYQHLTKNKVFTLGASCYNLNKPKQTLTSDPNQFLNARICIHANYEDRNQSGKKIISYSLIYQNQASVNYLQLGIISDFRFGNNDNPKKYLFGFGLYYRTNDAFCPVLRLATGQFLLSTSYDVTTSELKKAPSSYRSMEMSLQYIFKKKK